MLLFLSLVVVASAMIYGVGTMYERKQTNGLAQIIDDIVHAAEAGGGVIPLDSAALQRWLDDRADQYELGDRPMLLILDAEGSAVQRYPAVIPVHADALDEHLPAIMKQDRQLFELESDRDIMLLAVTAPIHVQDERIGYAIYLAPKHSMVEVLVTFGYSRLLTGFLLMILGWLVVYTAIRKLVRPIREVSEAAKQVVAGRYTAGSGKTYKEKEIHELMSSFQEMAEQLRQLDVLRAQLLAGVTHELKTPITSISGLTQAIKDKVVVGEEADEFLEYCILECNRLKKMVNDLLDFNSFAAKSIHVTLELCHLRDAVTGVITRWQLTEEQSNIQIILEAQDEARDWMTMTDLERLEQIIINLLNNARDAMDDGGTIIVRMFTNRDHFVVQVEDTGKGIPDVEHEMVFEAFYRGKEKKMAVRGLGIGLPFSRLIAQNLGGQLELSKSTREGTCFSLLLPRMST